MITSSFVSLESICTASFLALCCFRLHAISTDLATNRLTHITYCFRTSSLSTTRSADTSFTHKHRQRTANKADSTIHYDTKPRRNDLNRSSPGAHLLLHPSTYGRLRSLSNPRSLLTILPLPPRIPAPLHRTIQSRPRRRRFRPRTRPRTRRQSHTLCHLQPSTPSLL